MPHLALVGGHLPSSVATWCHREWVFPGIILEEAKEIGDGEELCEAGMRYYIWIHCKFSSSRHPVRPASYVEDAFLFPLYNIGFIIKSYVHTFTSRTSMQFYWTTCAFLYQYHAVFILIPQEYHLKSEIEEYLHPSQTQFQVDQKHQHKTRNTKSNNMESRK